MALVERSPPGPSMFPWGVSEGSPGFRHAASDVSRRVDAPIPHLDDRTLPRLTRSRRSRNHDRLSPDRRPGPDKTDGNTLTVRETSYIVMWGAARTRVLLVVLLLDVLLVAPMSLPRATASTGRGPILIVSDANFTAANGVVSGKGPRSTPT